MKIYFCVDFIFKSGKEKTFKLEIFEKQEETLYENFVIFKERIIKDYEKNDTFELSNFDRSIYILSREISSLYFYIEKTT